MFQATPCRVTFTPSHSVLEWEVQLATWAPCQGWLDRDRNVLCWGLSGQGTCSLFPSHVGQPCISCSNDFSTSAHQENSP